MGDNAPNVQTPPEVGKLRAVFGCSRLAQRFAIDDLLDQLHPGFGQGVRLDNFEIPLFQQEPELRRRQVDEVPIFDQIGQQELLPEGEGGH
jgi:hypothetical protein